MINMTSSAPLYMNAQEAAATLSVTPATIYAYVSRGLIRSEPSSDGRARRYRAEDVRSLQAKRAPAEMRESIEAPQPAAFESAICLMTPEGPFYRGASAIELSEAASFEQVAALLWNAADHDPFRQDGLEQIWAALAPVAAATATHPFIDRAAALMALAGSIDPAAYNGTIPGGAGFTRHNAGSSSPRRRLGEQRPDGS
jgi:citrate synthase